MPGVRAAHSGHRLVCASPAKAWRPPVAGVTMGGNQIPFSMPRTPHFTPALFDFLRALAANNNRDWFLANKPRYERDVRDPMLRFIGDFGARLRKISPHFVADPRPNGGSLFRIHRDTRFAKDKRPYKTNVGAHFRHTKGGDAHAPGFYLHLAPDEVFGGGGLWRPETETLSLVRDAIVDQPAVWRRSISGKAFTASCTLAGESLKRPPAGYDAAHPLIEVLKRKDFVAITNFDEAVACTPDFLDRYTAVCRASAPLIGFLTKSVGLAW